MSHGRSQHPLVDRYNSTIREGEAQTEGSDPRMPHLALMIDVHSDIDQSGAERLRTKLHLTVAEGLTPITPVVIDRRG